MNNWIKSIKIKYNLQILQVLSHMISLRAVCCIIRYNFTAQVLALVFAHIAKNGFNMNMSFTELVNLIFSIFIPRHLIWNKKETKKQKPPRDY